MSFLTMKTVALLATVAFTAGLEPTCTTDSECAFDEAHEVSLLQQGRALVGRMPESPDAPEPTLIGEAPKSPLSGDAPKPSLFGENTEWSKTRKGRHSGGQRPISKVARKWSSGAGGSHVQQRASQPELLMEGARAAGLPWTMEDAKKQVARTNRTRLGLVHTRFKDGRVAGDDVVKPDTTTNTVAASKLSLIGSECSSMNTVVGYNGCLGSLSVVFGTAAQVFFSGEELTLEDAYTLSSTLVIETLNMYAPVVGMVVSIASSFLASTLFPTADEDPYITAMVELAEQVLEQAAREATENLLATSLAEYSVEAAAIAGALTWLPNVLIDNTENSETLFDINLVMLLDISKLGAKIRDGTLAQIAGNQWSYSIMSVATQVAQLELALFLLIADHDRTNKAVVLEMVQRTVFGTGGWYDWYSEHMPKAKAYIHNEFKTCTMSVKWSWYAQAQNSYGPGPGKSKGSCSRTHEVSNCGNVLGMNLPELLKGTCSTTGWKRQCETDWMVGSAEGSSCKTECNQCQANSRGCASNLCNSCDRTTELHRLINSFDAMALQWRGIWTAAGGVGAYQEDQFEKRTDSKGCIVWGTSRLNEDCQTTDSGHATFSECWEKCFSHGKCKAIEFSTSDCTGVGTRVDGIKKSGKGNGHDFNFDWNSFWNGGEANNQGRILKVRQCRGTEEVWNGDVMVWNSKDSAAIAGNSHGRRKSGAAPNQWKTGDTVNPFGSPCSTNQNCKCNLVTTKNHNPEDPTLSFETKYQAGLGRDTYFGESLRTDSERCRS